MASRQDRAYSSHRRSDATRRQALQKLQKIDPESVRRANTFFSIPVPQEKTESKSSAVQSDDENRFAGMVSPHSPRFIRSDNAVAAMTTLTANPWRLASVLRVAGVLGMALMTIMIAQFLLLTGGAKPIAE